MIQDYVKAAQAGEDTGWNFLYRQHYPWMYATALHICGNTPATKDALQETFITAYLKLPQLKDTTAFAAWLKTILVRYCRRNAQKQLLVCSNCIPVENSSFYDDEIGRKMDEYEQQSKMYAGLSCLSETLQSVLLLRYFSDWYSYEEISAILCIPVGTVRSRLNQAKQKLLAHWAISNDDNDMAFKQANEWNNLYNDYFRNVYTSLQSREKLIAHFDKNLRLVFTSGKTCKGRSIVQQMIEEDMLYGNSFAGLEVISSGNISVIDCRNMNSHEYPDRCPASSVFVLLRTGDVTTQMNLHHSARD